MGKRNVLTSKRLEKQEEESWVRQRNPIKACFPAKINTEMIAQKSHTFFFFKKHLLSETADYWFDNYRTILYRVKLLKTQHNETTKDFTHRSALHSLHYSIMLLMEHVPFVFTFEEDTSVVPLGLSSVLNPHILMVGTSSMVQKTSTVSGLRSLRTGVSRTGRGMQ